MLEYYRFKAVHDLFMKGQEAEARLQLAELQRRYVALCDENTTFKMQVQEYEDILYLARNLTFDGDFYWLDTGSIRQGPFCPSCYDNDGLLMRLSGESPERFCTSCRKAFKRRLPPQELAPAMHQEFSRYPEFAPDLPQVEHALPLSETQPRRAKIIPFVVSSA